MTFRGMSSPGCPVAFVTEARPEVDAEQAIKAARVIVDGRTLTNPASLARRDAAITIPQESDDALRGEA
jgi:predicted rRNA methylase YqxC with S4 and FtsJ domains